MHGRTETEDYQEEHHQLPSHENVPEGRRSPEERRSSWLDASTLYPFLLLLRRSSSSNSPIGGPPLLGALH